MPIQFYMPSAPRSARFRRARRFGLSALLGIGALLLADWGASRAVQATLIQETGRLDDILNQQGFHFSHDAPVSSGWPVGAWVELAAPHLQGTAGRYEFGAAGKTLRLGGNWLAWLESDWRGQGFPARLEENSLFRLVLHDDQHDDQPNEENQKNAARQISESKSLTLRVRQLSLSFQALGNDLTRLADFQADHLEAVTSASDASAVLNEVKGRLSFHPTISSAGLPLTNAPSQIQFGTRPNGRIALRVTAASGRLSGLAFLEHLFASTLPGTPLAAGQIDATQLALAIGLLGDGALTEFPSDGPWVLRVQEAACDFPISPGETGPRPIRPKSAPTLQPVFAAAPPRLTLKGSLVFPAENGEISFRLERWRPLAAAFFDQPAVQNALDPRLKTLLGNDLAPPKNGKIERPLFVALPLVHGYPAGLTPERLKLLRHLSLSDLATRLSASAFHAR